MKDMYKSIVFLMMLSLAACVSNQSNKISGNDEDQDIGLGGTGMLAHTDEHSGGGLGGTGIVGEITGFGSIFVNGVEIEYNNDTPITVNGKTVTNRKLAIGDVVEVLASDENKHTLARVINLRHELIGKVESINPQGLSFIVHGQTVIQSLNNGALPEAGKTVAVSGFRIDEKTIMSSRVTEVSAGQSLIRTYTELPFAKQVNRWLLQADIHHGQLMVKLDSKDQVLSIKNESSKALQNRLNIKVLELNRSNTGQLDLKLMSDPQELPRGQLKEKRFRMPKDSGYMYQHKQMNGSPTMQQKMHRGGR
jgi:Domain of unknown function (DUF5666)